MKKRVKKVELIDGKCLNAFWKKNMTVITYDDGSCSYDYGDRKPERVEWPKKYNIPITSNHYKIWKKLEGIEIEIKERESITPIDKPWKWTLVSEVKLMDIEWTTLSDNY